jgi:hypothetical protein
VQPGAGHLTKNHGIGGRSGTTLPTARGLATSGQASSWAEGCCLHRRCLPEGVEGRGSVVHQERGSDRTALVANRIDAVHCNQHAWAGVQGQVREAGGHARLGEATPQRAACLRPFAARRPAALGLPIPTSIKFPQTHPLTPKGIVAVRQIGNGRGGGAGRVGRGVGGDGCGAAIHPRQPAQQRQKRGVAWTELAAGTGCTARCAARRCVCAASGPHASSKAGQQADLTRSRRWCPPRTS